MPHLILQHSANLPAERMREVCGRLLQVLAETRLYPLGGIRVRALPAEAYAIADRHPLNAFVDMVVRIGTGRSAEDKRRTGEAIMAAMEDAFADELSQPHFALSLEIVEIDPALSWKTNSIHPRLQGTA